MIKKTFIATMTIAVTAGTLALPNRANALDEWTAPTNVGTAIGSVLDGTTAAVQRSFDFLGLVAMDPDSDGGYCHPGREMGPDGSWHPVRVCEP